MALDGKTPSRDELVVSISTPTTGHRRVSVREGRGYSREGGKGEGERCGRGEERDGAPVEWRGK